ncbi:MAG: hypothetical protein ABI520_03530 [Caldimonas sp.]
MSSTPLCCLICLLATADTAAAGEPAAALPALAEAGRVAAPAPVRWAAAGEVADGGYRVSLTRGALDLGMRFEQPVTGARPLDAHFDGAAPAGTMLPALTFGLRSVSAGPAPASSLLERALASETATPYVSKVGIEWKPAPSQVFLNQGLGFRLGGDDKLTMRLRKGSLGIYMKRNF